MDDEKAFDDFLSIDTTLCIGAEQPTEENNIYQATYYRDLVTLFNAVSMEPEDTLVDFGCGLGRVLFYGTSMHYCRATGIEAMLTYTRSFWKMPRVIRADFMIRKTG